MDPKRTHLRDNMPIAPKECIIVGAKVVRLYSLFLPCLVCTLVVGSYSVVSYDRMTAETLKNKFLSQF